MAIYKLQDLLTQHGVNENQVTTFGSDESIKNSLNELNKPKEPTFLGKIARETVRPLANVATNVVNAGQIALGKEETQPFSGEYLGEVDGLGKLDMTKGFTPENIKVLKDSVKAGVDIGSLLAGGGNVGNIAKTGFKEGIKQGFKEGVKTGAIAGGVAGAGTGLEEDATLGSTLKNTALGVVGGAVVGGAVGGITGGVAPVASAARNVTTGIKRGAGNVLETTGQKIQNTVIKPSIRDVKDGFKIENVSKYDVGGSLPETVAKTHVKMNKLSQELRSKLKSSDSKLDLNKVYADTINKLKGDKALSFGDNSAIDRVVKSLGSEIKQVSKDGKVDLVRATNVKRGAGTKGAWAYNRPEADASAIEKVYSKFYSVLKSEIEKVAPPGVRDINKQISELIPINNAALRRMTVEERNNALSLMDNIGLVSSVFDPRALALFGTNRLLKSGKVGNYLTKTGQKLKGTTSPFPKGSSQPKGILPVKLTSPKSTTKSLKVKGEIPELNKGKITPKGLVVGSTLPIAIAPLLGSEEKIQAPKKQVIRNEKLGQILISLESSGGKNKANADKGEMKWLVGLTPIAIKDLKINGLLRKDFDKNNKEHIIEAGTKFFKLLQKKNPKLSPAEIYVDKYWNNYKTKEERAKRIKDFEELLNG